VSKPRSTKRAGVAVVLIDVINTFDFPGSELLVRAAKKAAPRIDALVTAARTSNVPVVYVNDNFGQWTSDFEATVEESIRPERPGRAVASRLRPVHGDYFVLKPQHSGFYGTPLELLLDHLEIDTLVLAGFATNICVLFTANDAHMRGFHLIVPRDCVAANTAAATRATLDHVRVALGGRTPAAAALRFSSFRKRARKPRGQTF
jgi:nicotinamidase-related amidase